MRPLLLRHARTAALATVVCIPTGLRSDSIPIVLLGALTFRDSSATPSLENGHVELRALFCSTASAWHAIADAACARRAASKGDAVAKARRTPDVESVWAIVRRGSPGILLHARPTATTIAARGTSRPGYRITSSLAAIPRDTTDARSFEQWTGPVVYRPLAAVTRDGVGDPEHWTTSTLTSQELRAFGHAFRDRVSLPACEAVPKNAPFGARLDYTLHELLVRSAYRSTDGGLLVGLSIDAALHPCDDVRDPTRTIHWFMGTKSSAPYFIGNEMQLVDIADFDGDGRSEWLFSVARYNEDGFLLCINLCRLTRVTTWHYH